MFYLFYGNNINVMGVYFNYIIIWWFILIYMYINKVLEYMIKKVLLLVFMYVLSGVL